MGRFFSPDREKIRQDAISPQRRPLYHLIRYIEENIGRQAIIVGIKPKETA